MRVFLFILIVTSGFQLFGYALVDKIAINRINFSFYGFQIYIENKDKWF